MRNANSKAAVPPQSQSAFTLIELSIVLVIIGFLVGGVVVAQTLIRASELRGITTEYQNYKAAISSFRDKYLSLPGDTSNAENFWGSAANCPGTNLQPSLDSSTCNGNGNKIIQTSLASGYGNEAFRFWQHLANSGLLDGSFTGVQGAAGASAAVVGENIPTGQILGSGWSASREGPFASGHASSFEQLSAADVLIFGAENGDNPSDGPLLTPDEAFQVDEKIDDGKPGQGKVTSVYWDDCSLATANTEADAAYAVLENSKACALRFKGFY